MRSFSIAENIVKKSVPKQANIVFYPLFAGIFIDLDIEVDIDNCDQHLGTTGLGCEYHLKDGEISKLFLELSRNYNIEIQSESEEAAIRNKLKGEVRHHTVISFEKARCFCPKKILLNEDFNVIHFFFSGNPLEQNSASFNYLKVSSNVAFGLTGRNELAAVIVTDFEKKIADNDLVIERAIEGSTHRFESFVKLNQQFYDAKINRNQFNTLVDNYLKDYKSLDEKTVNQTTDIHVLQTLISERTN